MTFSVGENVGAYRIVAQLGQGGMATVFKAYHPGLDRYVAIKVLHPAFKEEANFVQRFNREARIVAQLEHPNIVPVYDFAEHRGLAYLVMRFVDGETLKARLKRGPLRPDQIIQVARQVGAALDYAHQQGILHRDVKPSNVLLTGDPENPAALGDIFLADFGLARIAQAGESTLSRDMMMGTPQYISPEQAKGTRDLDAGADIYSLGVVLFELVTGRVPFSADTPYSIIHDHIFTPLPLPTSINPNVTEEVERVLLKALAKERADRYPEVNSFVTAFEQAIKAGKVAPAEPAPAKSATIFTPPPAPPTAVAKHKAPAKKRKRSWLYVGIGALLLLCLCSMLFVAGRVVNQVQINATATAQAAAPPPKEPTTLEEQIAIVEQHTKQHPADAVAHLELGLLYLEAGNVEAAEGQMREAVELRPEDEGIYLEVGQYLVGSGQRELAGEVYVMGLEVLPKSRPLRTGLAQVLWGLSEPGSNNLDYAEGLAHRLVAAAPDDPMSHVFLARVLIGQGKMDEARMEVDTALELAPRLPEAHLVNGIWFRKVGDLPQARREFQFALESDFAEEWLRLEIERELEKTDN